MKNIKEFCIIVRETFWNSFLRIFHLAIYSLRSLRFLRLNISVFFFLLRRVNLNACFLLMGAFFVFFSIPARAATGISNYEKGDFEGALQDFESRLKSGNTTAEIRFDAGAAAYKKGDYKKAVDYFTSAMTAPSPKIRSE